jgi:hypothetical protein
LLTSGEVWWTLVVLLLLASVAKIVPVTLASKLFTKKPWHVCFSIGVLMNTRGIVQLVVLNIGVQLKVLSPVIFALFVLMATILTFITSPVLYLIYRRGFDAKKLSNAEVAEELREIRDGESGINTSDIDGNLPTISNGEMGTEAPRRNSSKMFRLSGNMIIPDGLLTIEERMNYPEIDLDAIGTQPVVLGNLVTMPVCPPRRPVSMTRF